jgi:hypothetical protein
MAVARYREENGKISRKHGNALLRTRPETYGPGFATGRAEHAKTNLVRDRVAPTIRSTPTFTRAGTTQGKAVPLMFDPFRPWKTSFALSLQVARMCWEPQAVIFLRYLRIAESGAKAEAETTRMMTEKVASLAQAPATAAALNGSKKHGTAKKTVYARRVRRNRRRLSKWAEVSGRSARGLPRPRPS